MVNHKFRVIGACWVWAVSYASKTGQLGTWGIYGSEEKAKQEAEELRKVRKVPIKTQITPFLIDIQQDSPLGEIRCVDYC